MTRFGGPATKGARYDIRTVVVLIAIVSIGIRIKPRGNCWATRVESHAGGPSSADPKTSFRGLKGNPMKKRIDPRLGVQSHQEWETNRASLPGSKDSVVWLPIPYPKAAPIRIKADEQTHLLRARSMFICAALRMELRYLASALTSDGIIAHRLAFLAPLPCPYDHRR